MKIGIFGLGYVGSVCATIYANEGVEVVGVDNNKEKVDLINKGKPVVVEKDLTELTKKAVEIHGMVATTEVGEWLRDCDFVFITVGTPNDPVTGLLDVSSIYKVIDDCMNSGFISEETSFIIRSTVSPGTALACKKMLRLGGLDNDVLVGPEFLREGSAVADFYDPGLTVFGSDNFSQSVQSKIRKLNEFIRGDIEFVDLGTAEVIKYLNNSWHAVKVAFANEAGRILTNVGVDSVRAFDLFRLDKKLNLGGSYLSPGFSFGGSCLPKDLKGLYKLGEVHSVDSPMLKATLDSNRSLITSFSEQLLNQDVKTFVFHGITFKPGTDDLRFSPYLELAETLQGKGKEVIVVDDSLDIDRLLGENRRVYERVSHLNIINSRSTMIPTKTNAIHLLCHNKREYRDILERLDGNVVFNLTHRSFESPNINVRRIT